MSKDTTKTKTRVKSRGKRVSVDYDNPRPSFDITYCDNKCCLKRSACERNSDRAPFYLPVYTRTFDFDNTGECDYYVPMKESDGEP